ncbi:hypothetical protein ASG54_17145 [Aureimonas sp. Leaf460]|nr:hypothetical protein ASG62_20665 [Aureimonas sp. Leaf427]KQT73303.1 hypothetical protein ASG54_17145 [Aureimonas sp. Leaf460]
MVLPLLCLMVFGSIAMGVALWKWNALEEATAETARCLAIQSSDCGKVPAGCSGAAGACYAVATASARGLSDITPDQVTIDTQAVVDGISYVSVEIAYPFDLLGYRMTVSSTNHFPNRN